MHLSAIQLRILSILAHAGAANGLTLPSIAEAMQRKPPPVFMHLKEMVHRGLVERVELPRPLGPAYRARPLLHVTYVDPLQRRVATWQTNEPVSWRFPLVSRVPDAVAQSVLRTFLPQFEERCWDLLEDRGAKKSPSLLAPDPEQSMSLVVYGSCARGEARPSSDLDLLLVQPSSIDATPAAKALVAEANLWATRKIELRTVRRSGFARLPPDLQATIRRDGITVYTTFLGGVFQDPVLAKGPA